MKKIDKRIIFVYIFFIGIILLGITYALTSPDIGFNVASANIEINYNDNNNGTINLTNIKLIPILDSDVDSNTDNVIRINFTVSGNNPPSNAIYDIALNNLVVDNNLLSRYTKWKLKKNNIVISEGSLLCCFKTFKVEFFKFT